MKNSTQKENADLDRIWGFKDVCSIVNGLERE